MTRSARQDLYLGIGVIVLALLANFVLIPAGVNPPPKVPFKALHPAFWPNIIMWFMFAMGAVLVVQALMSSRGELSKDSNDVAAECSAEQGGWLRVAVAIVLFFVFLWLLNVIGFVAASVLALPVFMWLMGERRWYLIALVALLLPFGLHFFFQHVASVYVPLGFLEGLLGG